MRSPAPLALAALLCAACAAKVPDLRRTSGVLLAFDAGMRLPTYDDSLWEYYAADDLARMIAGGVGVGYRIRGAELYAQARLADTSTLGVEALYRFEQAPFLLLGGGLGIAVSEFEFAPAYKDQLALEVVLPRVDLRLPVSPSWEVSWTALRLSYVDTRVFHDSMEYDEEHGLALMSTVGLVARVNRMWEGGEREPLDPRDGGVTIDGSTWLMLLTPTASERREGSVAGESALGTKFAQRGAQILRLAPGVSVPVEWGFVEIGLPVSYYPIQSNGGVGLSLMWRPKTAGALSMGAAVHWFPRGYLLAELPRVDLAIRVSETVDLALTPIALVLGFQPGRDVWVEEGIERKMPYWGLAFSLGARWRIPARGLSGRR